MTGAVSQAEWILRLTAAASFGFAVVAWGASTVDARVLGNENVWVKPLKFGVSVGVYLATLAWAAAWLSPAWRQGRALHWIAVTAGVCAAFELGYIGWQAFQGQHSHFKVDTPFHAAMYGLMAVGAIALVLSGGALGAVVARDSGAAFSKAMRWSVAVAFPLSMALTILTGLAMGSRMSHHVGVETAVVRVPVTGWSLTVGDLRVPHFLATHLTQGGPLFAWLMSHVAGEGAAPLLSLGFCGAWAGLTWILLRLTLDGKPFLALLR